MAYPKPLTPLLRPASRPGRPRLGVALTLLLAVLAVPRVAAAVSCGSLPLDTSFTGINVSGTLGSNFPFASDCTIDGSTSLDQTASSNLGESPGGLHGVGTAKFDKLSASIELSGPAGLHAVTSAFSQEFFTIDKPGALPGETGTMRLRIGLSAGIDVKDPGGNALVGPDVFGGVSLSVSLGNPKLVPGAQSLFSQSYDLASGAPLAVIAGGGWIDVPFTYGVLFGVGIQLSAGATSDNHYIGGVGTYGGGTVGSILVDASHSADLQAIGLSAGDVLTAGSSTDYAPYLVTVPEPGSGMLLVVALGALGGWRRTARRAAGKA